MMKQVFVRFTRRFLKQKGLLILGHRYVNKNEVDLQTRSEHTKFIAHYTRVTQLVLIPKVPTVILFIAKLYIMSVL